MPEDFECILKQKHILSLSTCDNKQPWICSVFYIYESSSRGPSLFFATEHSTRHAQEFKKNNKVAANIYNNTKEIKQIYGIQCTGTVSLYQDDNKTILNHYLSAFPFAKKMFAFPMWCMTIEFAKLTDNRKEFAYKKEWKKNDTAH